MFSEFCFESDGVVNTHRQAKPLNFPRFKRFGTSVISFVVGSEFGIGVFRGADEPAVHTINEDVNDFFHTVLIGSCGGGSEAELRD